MKKRNNRFLMLVGLLLIAAALLLTLYNTWVQKTAETASGDVLGQLADRIAEGTPEPERIVLPTEIQDVRTTVAQSAGSTAKADASVTVTETASEMPEESSLAPCETTPPENISEATASPEPSPMPTIETLPVFVRNPGLEMPIQRIDGNDYIGILEIPSLSLSLPVISEWNYPRLRIAPCRYTGSVYSGDIVISGHNYERHFGQLKVLTVGEEVRFTDTDGNMFYYSVCETEQLGKYDVYEMKNGDWDLTMFTCTYGGKNRVTVRCKLERYECP